jgi:hypothetical protein
MMRWAWSCNKCGAFNYCIPPDNTPCTPKCLFCGLPEGVSVPPRPDFKLPPPPMRPLIIPTETRRRMRFRLSALRWRWGLVHGEKR